jgi:hypothetical protein
VQDFLDPSTLHPMPDDGKKMRSDVSTSPVSC